MQQEQCLSPINDFNSYVDDQGNSCVECQVNGYNTSLKYKFPVNEQYIDDDNDHKDIDKDYTNYYLSNAVCTLNIFVLCVLHIRYHDKDVLTNFCLNCTQIRFVCLLCLSFQPG